MQEGGATGFLLGEGGRIPAHELYDPTTGKALLVRGAPLDPLPPPPDAVRIGIIDSGVIPGHPQLRNLVVAMKDFTGNDPVDRIGHGTLMALRLVEVQTAALAELRAADPALAETLNRSQPIVSAKVTSADGQIKLESVIKAIHWVVSQNVRVVNLSLGFIGSEAIYAPLCKAIRKYATAPNNGVFFAAAAGNFGPSVRVYPAACDVENLLSVGAVIDGRVWEKSGPAEMVAEGQVRVMTLSMYHYEAAQTATRAGALDAARTGYSASLAAEENYPALFGLAVLDIHMGQLDAAYASLSRAAELAPNIGMIAAELGAVRLLQGRPADAKAHLDRAIELEPENTSARANRAIALARLGQAGLALEDLLEARRTAADKSRIDALIQDLVQSLAPPAKTRRD